MNLQRLKRLVEQQAKDEGLWFIAQYASEAYLQRALRLLHEAVERCEDTTPTGDAEK